MARASALSIDRPARPAPATSGPSNSPRIEATSRANPLVSARTLTTRRSISSSIYCDFLTGYNNGRMSGYREKEDRWWFSADRGRLPYRAAELGIGLLGISLGI